MELEAGPGQAVECERTFKQVLEARVAEMGIGELKHGCVLVVGLASCTSGRTTRRVGVDVNGLAHHHSGHRHCRQRRVGLPGGQGARVEILVGEESLPLPERLG